MRLLLESRLKLLKEGEEAKPLSRVVGHRHAEEETAQ